MILKTEIVIKSDLRRLDIPARIRRQAVFEDFYASVAESCGDDWRAVGGEG